MPPTPPLHSTNSLLTAASPDFQGLVDTLCFLALLLLTAGLLLLRGQGHLPLHLLHFQQLQEELQKQRRVRGKAWSASTNCLSRTPTQTFPSQSSLDENHPTAPSHSMPRLAARSPSRSCAVPEAGGSPQPSGREKGTLQPAPGTTAGRAWGQLLPGGQRRLLDTEQSHGKATASSDCLEPHPIPYHRGGGTCPILRLGVAPVLGHSSSCYSCSRAWGKAQSSVPRHGDHQPARLPLTYLLNEGVMHSIDGPARAVAGGHGDLAEGARDAHHWERDRLG